RADEFLRVDERIRMRDPLRVLGDATVVRELRDRFGVLEARGAQHEPLGLEDGNTAFAVGLRRSVVQQGHGTGSFKSIEGEPAVPSPPLGTRSGPPVRLGCRRTSHWSAVLLGRRLRHRVYGHVGAAFGFGTERNLSIYECEKRVILAHSHIMAGMPFGAALARENVAGEDNLSAERLHAETPPRRVPPLARSSPHFTVVTSSH